MDYIIGVDNALKFEESEYSFADILIDLRENGFEQTFFDDEDFYVELVYKTETIDSDLFNVIIDDLLKDYMDHRKLYLVKDK